MQQQISIKNIPDGPPVEDSRYLESIYGYQKLLIDKYIDIEGLPEYPLDINNKANQALVKDFISRIITELAEGHCSHLAAINLIKADLYQVISEEVERPLILEELVNLNEELADALHFMVETLVYCNIQPSDIMDYMFMRYKMQADMAAFFGVNITSTDILAVAMELGYNVITDELKFDLTGFKTIHVHELVEKAELWDVIFAGKDLVLSNYDTVEAVSKFLWVITFTLSMAGNHLKNKAWRKTQVETDEASYQEKLVQSFIYLCGYFKLLGADSYGIYQLYYKKNQMNHLRIANSY